MPARGDKLKRVALISKPSKPELKEIIPQVLDWLSDRGYEVAMDEETAVYGSNENVYKRACISGFNPDFAIVLGGDGTLLSAARSVSKSGVPILAVNLGSLGFLTEVKLGEMWETLAAVDQGQCPIEERAVLECRLIRGGELVASHFALNDAVVKSAIARLISFELCINGELAFEYRADGVIVATPTGSTAYSLAAGGPVLMPQVDAVVITPICPHSLTHRPLVVHDDARVELVLKSGSEEGVLSIDGQVRAPVMHGDRIECRRGAHNVKLLRMNKTFFDVLRTKLKWGLK